MISVPSSSNPVGLEQVETKLSDVEASNANIAADVNNNSSEVSTLKTQVNNVESTANTAALKAGDLEILSNQLQQTADDQGALLSTTISTVDQLVAAGAKLDPAALEDIQLRTASFTYESLKAQAVINRARLNGSGELTQIVTKSDMLRADLTSSNSFTLLEHTRNVNGFIVQCPETEVNAIPSLDARDRKDNGGRYPTLADAISDTSANLENSVMFCKDLLSEEFWFEDISTLDVVFINGDVHDKGLNLGSVRPELLQTMTDLSIPLDYTAMHDRHVQGNDSKGIRWSSMPHADRIAFLSDSRNRIFLYGDTWVQLRRRVVLNRLPGSNVLFTDNGIYSEGNTFKVPVRASNTSSVALLESGAIYDTEVSEDRGFKAYTIFTPSGINESSIFTERSFLMPITTIQKRNDGTYVPGLNSYGTGPIPSLNSSVNEVAFWHESSIKGISDGASDGLILPVDLADCFNKDNWVSTKHGYFEEGAVNPYTPLGQVHDAVYESDFKFLAHSCMPIDDHKVLLDTVLQLSVTAQTDHTSQVPFTKINPAIPSFYYSAVITDRYLEFKVDNTGGAYIDFSSYGLNPGDGVMVWQPSTGYKAYGTMDSGSGRVMLHSTFGELATGRQGGFVDGLNMTDPCYIASVTLEHYDSTDPIWCDVLGTYQSVAAIYPDGFYGTWNGEYEHSKIVNVPTLTRKAVESKAVLALSSSVITGHTESVDLWELANIDQDSNTLNGSYGVTSDLVTTVFYRVAAIEVELSEHSKIVSYTDVKVLANSEANKGNALQESITGNINTGGGILGTNLPIISSTITTDAKFSNVYGSLPEHHPVGYSHGDPLVLRLLPYLSIKEGSPNYTLMLGFNELRRNLNAYNGAPINDLPEGVSFNVYKGQLYRLPDTMENAQFANAVLIAVTDGELTLTNDRYNDASFIRTSNDIKNLSTGQYDSLFNQFNGSAWAGEQSINMDPYFNSEKDLAGRDVVHGCCAIKLNILAGDI